MQVISQIIMMTTIYKSINQITKQSDRKVLFVMKQKILLVDDKSTIGKVAGVYLGKEYDLPIWKIHQSNRMA